MTDLYTTLGIPQDADEAAIKAVHRRLAKQHHPDTGGDRDKFDEIQHAVAVLRDPDSRARYDATGDDTAQPDNSQARRLELLIMAFDRAIDPVKDRLDRVDIIPAMRRTLETDIADTRKIIAQWEKQAKQIDIALERLTCRGGKSSPIHAAMTGRLRKIEASRLNAETEIGHAQAALAMVDDYVWQFEAPQPAPAQGGGVLEQYLNRVRTGQADTFFNNNPLFNR